MKKLSFCASAMLISTLASSVVIADSQNIRLTGSITPAACAITLTGTENLEYGNISPSQLQPDAYTVLEQKNANLAIDCGVPTRVAFKAVNGQPGTLAGGTELESGFGPAPHNLLPENGFAAGLGLQEGSGNKIGGFTLNFGQPVLNGGQGVSIARREVTDSPLVWRLNYRGSLFGLSPMLLSWGMLGAQPASIKTLTAPLNVQPYINKASELNLSQPIALAGKISLEVIYF